jgi:hypothetical protein
MSKSFSNLPQLFSNAYPGAQPDQTFSELKLEKHPNKTLIGKTERGYDFLSYRFEQQRLNLSKKTITNFITKVLRLYEQ